MAKFVLAGKANCPHYAKAELLADTLQRCLPDFRVHKIAIMPGEWEDWLDDICKRNGWKHKSSPVVWRELIERGGKGMLLGGFSDFLEHCQDYYGVTSDMKSEMMMKIAAENLENQLYQIEEEKFLQSLIEPLNIWITGALSQTSHILIPKLLSDEVFPNVEKISLHLMDQEESEIELIDLRREIEALSMGRLHEVTLHCDLDEAFQDAHVILLLDDIIIEDADKNSIEKMQGAKRELLDRYKEYGMLINTRANKEVKVILSGVTLTNLRCWLLINNARSIDSHQFIAPATQLEDEARAVIAEKIRVRPADVVNVTVWGNISGNFYVDLRRASAYNYVGAIKGPSFYSQAICKIFFDREWLDSEYQELVRSRRAAVVEKLGESPALSTANSILRILKVWSGASNSQEALSAAIISTGAYNLSKGIVFSAPVLFIDGKWTMDTEIALEDDVKRTLRICAFELQQEKKLNLRD